MPRPKTLPAFTPEEKERVHSLLAVKVAYMKGRKMEEGVSGRIAGGGRGEAIKEAALALPLAV